MKFKVGDKVTVVEGADLSRVSIDKRFHKAILEAEHTILEGFEPAPWRDSKFNDSPSHHIPDTISEHGGVGGRVWRMPEALLVKA